MLTDRGFLTAGGRTGGHRVERTALLTEIDTELARVGVVVLCGPWGYGKTTLLRDYARIAHARTPSRPIVRVDFDTFEPQAFLAGNHGPLLSGLRRLGKGREPREQRNKLRRLPARHSSAVTHCVYEMLAAYAPTWRTSYENGRVLDEAHFADLPLLAIDNLPRMEEGAQAKFADALLAWAASGVRTIVACQPSTFPNRALFPGVAVLGGDVLGVSDDEALLWVRDMRLNEDSHVLEGTGGVPMLVAARRSVRDAEPAFDEGFLRVSERVLEHCLNEPMCTAAERARHALAMLGSGSIGDLALVGAPLRADELSILAETYPLFGIDLMNGTFACIPAGCGNAAGTMARVVGRDEVLASRCIELLASRGRLKRAGDLASLMSDAARLRLFGACPDVFADAANAGSIERALKSVAACEVAEASRPGLARLTRMYAYACDVPMRSLPEFLGRQAVEPDEGALKALREVRGFWGQYSAPADAPCDAAADEPDEDAGDGSGAERGAYLRFDDAEHTNDTVGGLVWLMGLAGLRGDGKAYASYFDDLQDQVGFARGGLAVAIYAFHAAVCGFLCDKAEDVLSWLGPMAALATDASAPKGSVTGVSAALLSSAFAMARFLVEPPSAKKVTSDTYASLHAARRFFEERGIEPGSVVVALFEALCLVASANERQATALVVRCQTRWSVQGSLLGQLAANLGLCATHLAQDAVNQAMVYARTAETLAQRLGVRRAVWLARLFESIATIRAGSKPDIDRRLLEATLRQTSLHPQVSVALNLEVAFLQAARGDVVSARDGLHGVGLFCRPTACRILVVALRAMRKHRSCVMELLPRHLRVEYESLKPVAASRLCASVDPMLPTAGLLALPGPGKGLSVGVFGGLRVEINGHVVGEREWGRRKSRRLILVLALFPDTPLSREGLVEALWGDRIPTVTVRNNLNTALTSLRASLGQKGGGPEYVVTSGNSVGFNLELVDVDVMRFERLARTILARRNLAESPEVLEACSVVEQIFQTGLEIEFDNEEGRVRRRVEELTRLFIDCMKLGCERALAEKDPSLAVWFARAAHRIAPKREDVEAMLDEAMKAMCEQIDQQSGDGDALEPLIEGDVMAPCLPCALDAEPDEVGCLV